MYIVPIMMVHTLAVATPATIMMPKKIPVKNVWYLRFLAPWLKWCDDNSDFMLQLVVPRKLINVLNIALA